MYRLNLYKRPAVCIDTSESVRVTYAHKNGSDDWKRNMDPHNVSDSDPHKNDSSKPLAVFP